MSNQWIEKAIAIMGSQTALAQACGRNVKQQHIWNWLNRDKKVPAEFVLAIERATQGRVTRHQLRPDLYASREPHTQPVKELSSTA